MIVVSLSILSGCLAQPRPRAWSFNDLAAGPTQIHKLQDSTGFAFSVSTKTIASIIAVDARLRDVIKDIVEIDAEILLVESNEANAFVAMRYDKAVICITVPMVMLIGNDIDLYAALLSHEISHLSWGHLQDSLKRRNFLTFIGLALSATPAAVIAPFGLAAISAAYSRDQEREADALGIELLVRAKFDPKAAISLQEVLRKYSGDVASFLATHPSSDERIASMKMLIEANQMKR